MKFQFNAWNSCKFFSLPYHCKISIHNNEKLVRIFYISDKGTPPISGLIQVPEIWSHVSPRLLKYMNLIK